jgi:hypothetical protein
MCCDTEMAAKRELLEWGSFRDATNVLAQRLALTQRKPLLRFSLAQTARIGLPAANRRGGLAKAFQDPETCVSAPGFLSK